MLAEVAPLLEPHFDAAVISLVVLLTLLVAIALVQLAEAIVHGLFTVVGGITAWIPVVNRLVQKPLHDVEKKLSDALGSVEQPLDRAAGRWFSSLAKLVEWIGQEIRRHANLIWLLSTVLVGPEITRLIRDALRAVRHEIAALKATTHTITRTVTHTIVRQVVRVEHTVTTRVKSASAVVTHAVTVDIPWLRARDKALSEEYEALRKRIASLARAVPTAAVGALALAMLAKIGAGWLRCSNWRKIGSAGCRLPLHWLEDLLALAVDFVVLTEICEIIPWLERGFAEVEQPLTDLVTGVGKALCHGDYSPAPVLKVPELHRPANPTDAPLALP